MNKWTRRAFIGAGSVVGGGLAIGIGEFVFAPNRLGIAPAADTGTRLTTWIKLAADNTITVVVPHCEMGQGSQTGLAMMLAEELEADWNSIRVEEAPGTDEFAAGYMVRGFGMGADAPAPPMLRGIEHLSFKVADWLGLQVTGGSASIRFTGEFGMRVAGASAKEMLLQAAAVTWSVPVAECNAKLSHIEHVKSGRRATFGDLAVTAAQLDIPAHPTLKSREAFTIIGTPKPRFDIPAKVNGGTTYGLDVQLPELTYAAVKAAPIFGGKLLSVDPSPALSMPGVVKVVQLENAVAVVADGYWRAQQALDKLQPQFDGGQETVNSDTIFEGFAQILAKEAGSKVVKHGDGADALTRAVKKIEAEYRVPFLAHITMEPMNATVRIKDEACEVWAGTQDPLNARAVAAKASGLDADQVTVHNLQLGGGFGRRLPGNLDYVDQATRIAKEMSPRPVKLIWNREEDMRHDFYRSAILGRYQGGLNADGKVETYVARFNGDAGDGAAELPYSIPNQAMSRSNVKTHIRLGAWRSVDHTQHGFFKESFIDELAHAAGQDPFEFRRGLLADNPRFKSVLELAAEKAGWGSPLAAGRGRGIALVESFGTIVCQVAEVEVLGDRYKVHRVVAVVDCGAVVNPDSRAA
ncbi:MAG TPA: molybdopterin cofactor-binding domain-containing protein, partial [Steroidobacteraceae bacterium]|nr:molybdopterin cofactor-binding domain-containing protein [Steroidobacteraceae bacterium]